MTMRPARLSCLLFLGWLSGATTTVRAQQASVAGPAAAPDPQKVVLSVDDSTLTVADVEEILQTLPPQTREYYNGPGHHLLPQYLVRMKVLSLEAKKQKLDQQPEIRKAVEFAAESILADAERRKMEANIAAPDDLVAQLYELRKKELEQVRLRRLLIRTESSVLSQSSEAATPPLSSADARKKLAGLRQEILAGADFAELAKLHSDDAASAASGGDLGYVSFRMLIPPIMQAADRLAPGEVSDVIPTAFGMELIQVVDKRPQPLEEVRPQLEATLRQSKLEEKLQELQGQYKIDLDTEYFAPRETPLAPFGTFAQ